MKLVDGKAQLLLSDECEDEIDIPTCHIVGCADPWLQGSLALYNLCNDDLATLFDREWPVPHIPDPANMVYRWQGTHGTERCHYSQGAGGVSGRVDQKGRGYGVCLMAALGLKVLECEASHGWRCLEGYNR